jgi:hypothetical protein
VAGDLSASRDSYSAAAACSAALRLSPTYKPCLDRLERLADAGDSPAAIALGYYGLANAGVRALPNASVVSPTLPLTSRLQMALEFRHLRDQDRVDLLQPVLASGDAALRYQALLLLATIPGERALAVIRAQPQNTGALGLARTLALAVHGDQESLKTVSDRIGSLTDYLRILGGLALALDGDPRGESILADAAAAPVELHRMHAVEALARTNPTHAARVARELLTSGSRAIHNVMIGTAGRVGLGTVREVYRELTSADEEARVQAVIGISETLVAARPPATRR